MCCTVLQIFVQSVRIGVLALVCECVRMCACKLEISLGLVKYEDESGFLTHQPILSEAKKKLCKHELTLPWIACWLIQEFNSINIHSIVGS